MRRLSVIIPTYQREQVLLDTIGQLLELQPSPHEILVVDQTSNHELATIESLQRHHNMGHIRWIQLAHPSITHAMNTGLVAACGEIVLFLDDDIKPHQKLFEAHISAHLAGHGIVAGQVLQPGEVANSSTREREFSFSSSTSQSVTELMGGNFSINRDLAISIGGFDENFVHVAYRFEAEFAQRARSAGHNIYFEASASIRHLKVTEGGTRSFGNHLMTVKPSHAVGAYYYALRRRGMGMSLLEIAYRPLRAIRTKHHATHPWWIPATLVAELLGFMWAILLCMRGPRLLRDS